MLWHMSYTSRVIHSTNQALYRAHILMPYRIRRVMSVSSVSQRRTNYFSEVALSKLSNIT